jgi:transposase
MNFYKTTHKHYCGVDLHSTSMYLCVVDKDGAILLHRSLPCDPVRFLLAIAPFREGLVVAVECVYSWYWLADLCDREGIAFVLGHALYMRSIHGAKAKSDKIDSEKIAHLLRGGLMPIAYAYPPEMRATRDLMRRRLLFVRQRGALLAHIQITHHQYNVAAPGKRITYRSNRDGLGEGFSDPSLRQSIAADLALADHYEVVVGELELAVLRQARIHDPNALALLTSFPGIGKVLALTILYEIHDISRFPSVGDFASYSRLVKCAHISNGKNLGTGGAKIGNAYLKWAFSEAAVLFIAKSEHGRTVFKRLERKHGKAKALALLAHKIGRTVYFMLARKRAFEPQRFAAAA